MELNVSLYDFFDGAIYEQLVKTKSKQNVVEIIAETAITRITERGATRMDDQTSDASMELRKKEGYF